MHSSSADGAGSPALPRRRRGAHLPEFPPAAAREEARRAAAAVARWADDCVSDDMRQGPGASW